MVSVEKEYHALHTTRRRRPSRIRLSLSIKYMRTLRVRSDCMIANLPRGMYSGCWASRAGISGARLARSTWPLPLAHTGAGV